MASQEKRREQMCLSVPMTLSGKEFWSSAALFIHSRMPASLRSAETKLIGVKTSRPEQRTAAAGSVSLLSQLSRNLQLFSDEGIGRLPPQPVRTGRCFFFLRDENKELKRRAALLSLLVNVLPFTLLEEESLMSRPPLLVGWSECLLEGGKSLCLVRRYSDGKLFLFSVAAGCRYFSDTADKPQREHGERKRRRQPPLGRMFRRCLSRAERSPGGGEESST
jgi:hypothetical protein